MLILFIECNPIEGENKVIKLFVKKMLQNYTAQNSEKFNQFINKSEGLVLITATGSTTMWTNVETLSLNSDCLEKNTNADSSYFAVF